MKRKLIALAVGLSMLLEASAIPVCAENGTLYEAEDAAISGTLQSYDEADVSGGKVIGNFAEDTDVITFTVEIPTDGSYNIIITSKGIGGDKVNNVLIDGDFTGTFESKGNVFSDAVLRSVMMTSGIHEISITKSWGWMTVDCIKIEAAEAIPDSIYEVSNILINPNANAETQALFSYLCEGYGKQILSGQVADNGLDSDEFKAIYDVTGKFPAILGLDMMDYCPSRTEKGSRSQAVERAIEFHEKGGIVTFCWHWNAPDKYIKEGPADNGTPRWWSGFSTVNTTFDIAAVMEGNDPEGKALIDADIAEIAKQIGRLQDAGVPVLWRPLHEASGGWFWWGAKGADAYKSFWKYLYEQLTDVYGCNNLIWVWNGQSADWYPGEEYVDIIGEDIYTDTHAYTAHTAKFSEILDYSGGNKMIALTENGTIFDIDNAISTNAKWAWFNTWSGGFITKDGQFSDEFTEAEILQKNYQSEYVITLDELPDWSTYLPTPTVVKGDVNADGEFNLADVVLMQKWLLAVPDTTLNDWKAGDLCEDNRIDVFDLCLMKRLLIYN